MKPGEIVHKNKTIDGNEIIIRYVKMGDAESMCDYINEVSKERTFISFQGEQMTVKEEEEWVRSLIKAMKEKTAFGLLLFIDEKQCGMGSVEMKKRSEKHVGSLGISLRKEARGKGLGKLFLDTILKEAKKNIPELQIMTLTVLANNHIAHTMYKKFGFVEHGKLPKGSLHREDYVDLIELHKILR